MNNATAIPMFAALSQETRLEIIRYLIGVGAKGASAGDIGAHVQAASSRASFHLAALERAQIITSEKRSRQIIYRADLGQLGGLISFLLNDCCKGHPDVLACCKAGCQ